jgi:hypothetical protein
VRSSFAHQVRRKSMPTDPLSHVASWIAPANTEIEPSLSLANPEPNEERTAEDERIERRLLETFERLKPRPRKGGDRR